MNSDAILMCFLSVAAIFLYMEKIKFAPPMGKMLRAWRLIYFGSALAFFVVGIFFYLNEEMSEMPILRGLLLLSLFIFGMMIFAGFAIFFKVSRSKE